MPLHTKFVNWKLLKNKQQINSLVKSWLLDNGSSTKRLKAITGNNLNVEVVNQGWVRALREEKSLLGIRDGQKTLVREVILYCKNIPWMYGRSVFPITIFTGKTKYLFKSLNERPLGELLFNEKSLQRGQFEYCLLNSRDTKYPLLKYYNFNQENLWARRSIFFLQDSSLLLTEVFLPQMLHAINVRANL